jgi:hypothetical protein
VLNVSNPKVGINEINPDVTLHVTRPVGDPDADVDLAPGKGITVFGPIIGQNLGFDSHQIQARTGAYVNGTTTIGFTATALNIQPRGGDIVFHSSYTSDKQIVITDAGLVGLGKTPIERLDINGAVTFGDTQTASPAEGTVRWHVPAGSAGDLEVFKNGAWKSLTTQTVTDGFGPAGTGMITYNAANGKVGIGVAVPTETFEVNGTIKGSGKFQIAIAGSSAAGGSVAGFLSDQSASSTTAAENRTGLQISNTGTWSSNASSKDVGLYVSNVSGQTANESNIAAVLNGNTVIGDVSASVVGAGGTNVLAIQSGAAPTAAPGPTTTGGIQIYSEDMSTGAVSPPVSVFNVMTGEGHVIKLFGSPAITAPDNSALNSTYGTNEQSIIDNMRSRINQLEQVLIAHGLLN